MSHLRNERSELLFSGLALRHFTFCLLGHHTGLLSPLQLVANDLPLLGKALLKVPACLGWRPANLARQVRPRPRMRREPQLRKLGRQRLAAKRLGRDGQRLLSHLVGRKEARLAARASDALRHLAPRMMARLVEVDTLLVGRQRRRFVAAAQQLGQHQLVQLRQVLDVHMVPLSLAGAHDRREALSLGRSHNGVDLDRCAVEESATDAVDGRRHEDVGLDARRLALFEDDQVRRALRVLFEVLAPPLVGIYVVGLVGEDVCLCVCARDGPVSQARRS